MNTNTLWPSREHLYQPQGIYTRIHDRNWGEPGI